MSDPEDVVCPPPELRGLVDRTAKFVAKSGPVLEERIMRDQGKPKFSFLFSDDPHYAYYRLKVEELKQKILSENDAQQQQPQNERQEQGHFQQDRDRHETNDAANDQEHHHGASHQADRPDETTSANSGEISQKIEGHVRFKESDEREDKPRGSREPGVRPKLDEYMLEISMRLEEPSNLNFLASPASSTTHLESDIIKLTSQYIATYGRSFLLELVSREQGNSRFDFLKPQHGQFPYMTNLIMQYALIMNAPLDILEQLEKSSTSQKHVLDRIKMRAEWNRMLELERRKRDEAKEQEKLLYSQIDWHDFVIVETIDYQPGETGAYPPTTPDQVGTRLLMQQRTEDHTMPEEMEIDDDMEE